MKIGTLVTLTLLLLCGFAGAQSTFCAANHDCTVSGNWSFAGPIKEVRSPQKLVAVGDSITAGNQIPVGDEWPSQAANLPMFFQRGLVTNTAVSGYTCANMTSDYATKAQPLRPAITGIPTLIGGSIGRNNFAAGDTAATVEACVSAYWAQARTDGFKIIAFTVYDTTGIVSETERNAYNTWVKANGTLYDYLVDLDAAFPLFTDTTLILADQIHPTVLGANKIANLVNAAVGGVNNFPTVAKYEQQATSIARAPIFSAEPSGTTPGAGYVYNTLSTRGSYERGVASWNTNVFEVGSEMADANSKGMSNRSTRLKSALDIKFAAAGTDWWQLRTNGPLYCITDGTCDIGQTTNNRPNNISAKNIVDAIFLRAYNSAGGPGEMDIFNTVDSVSAPVNFERLAAKWVSNEARIGAEAGGTGTIRGLRLLGSSVTVNGTAPLTLGQTTVAALPAAASNAGAMILVTDSTAVAAEGQTCAGSSTNKAVAISNGSAWKCF